MSNNLHSFENLNKIQVPNPLRILGYGFVVFIVVMIFILSITPWRQTSRGYGRVIASDPNNRAQEISTPISGRIKQWHVQDGSKVKEGDVIAEIVDNDPDILERIKTERDSKKRKLEVVTIASQTAKINYDRQEDLFKKGLSSRKEYEEAKIEYQKLLSTQETTSAELAESETKLSRQQNQIIYAPKDGVILKVLSGNNATVVKAGDKIADFAPNLNDPVVELYVNPNDIPLVHEGRLVRLQFEGWPVVQLSGWPSLAIGTFGGVVTTIDPSISENGKFRVMIKKPKDEIWPDQRFIRHGTKTYGWILLNEVRLGYEIWRQVNAFPPEFDRPMYIEKTK